MLVPEGATSTITANDAPGITVFRTLDEFAKHKPKRVRKPRKTKEVNHANLN